MSTATTTDSQPGPLHAADSHDLITVQGARVNNLKDISVEIPKRRLTVFTGVSGSGKSSLVFATIAAESQRMINETYSAFVQGFMPTLARPEVDHLFWLTGSVFVLLGCGLHPPTSQRSVQPAGARRCWNAPRSRRVPGSLVRSLCECVRLFHPAKSSRKNRRAEFCAMSLRNAL